MKPSPRLLILIAMLLSLAGCRKAEPPAMTAASASVNQSTAALSKAELGRLIFHDVSLSASGRQSCASCHDPGHAHAQPNAIAGQPGGAAMDQRGTRAVPSLRYLTFTPAFGIDDEGTPSGGFNWDGSADTLAAQAERPLLAANEMANGSRAAVVDKLRRAAYAAQFRQVYGERSLDDVDAAFLHLGDALERFQRDAPEFHPFTSKYDAWQAGKAELSAAEQRGLKLFNDEKKGNCAACHPSAKADDGRPPLFTDHTYDALGLARNRLLPVNADPAHVDLGLCKSGRPGPAADDAQCGKFKVPTLRNVATRAVFFHNGQIASLRDAVAFYVRRDTHPAEWYPKDGRGKVAKYDDLPARHHKNVNVDEVPYDRKPGQAPRLNAAEIDDLVAFLHTLTDADLVARAAAPMPTGASVKPGP